MTASPKVLFLALARASQGFVVALTGVDRYRYFGLLPLARGASVIFNLLVRPF